MKNYRILTVMLAVTAVSFAFVGFQCSSAELTSAKLYMQKNQWDKAEEELQKDVVTNPQDEEAWYYLGYARGERQNWTGMKDAFEHALSISDVDKQNIINSEQHYWVQLYNQGTKDLQRGRDTSSYYDSAIVAFRGAITVEPDSLLSYKGLAYTFLNKTLEDSAVQPLSVLWSKTKDEDAAKFLSEIYYEKGQKLKQDFLSANEDKLETLKNINSIQEGSSEEDVAAAIGQPDQKTTQAEQKGKSKRKTTGPQSDVWVYKTYGLTLTFDQDKLKTKRVDYNPQIDSTKYQAALAQFQNALDVVVPATNMYQDDRDLMTVMTNCYIAADMTLKATESFKKGAIKNPDNADFQYNYGVILLRSNDFENAIAQFKKAIDAGNATAEQLQAKLAHPDSSVDLEKVGQDLSRTKVLIWNATYNLGAGYYNWGGFIQNEGKDQQNNNSDSLNKVVKAKIDQALPYLEKYIAEKGEDPNGWEVLGKVYTFLSDKQKAYDAFQKADSLRQAH